MSIRITEFFVEPSLVWSCAFCGTAITERRSGIHHKSTGACCQNCGAPYDIQWQEPVEQSVIEMESAESEVAL